MKRDLTLFLKDIIEHIDEIRSFTKDISKSSFMQNKEKQNAVIRSIEVIGEAVKNVPDSFRKKYPEIPWSEIAGTRDIITHGYFRIDLDAVWNVVQKDISVLRKQIEDIIKKEKD